MLCYELNHYIARRSLLSLSVVIAVGAGAAPHDHNQHSGLDLTRSPPPRCPTPRTTYTYEQCNSAPVESRNRNNKQMNYGILHNHNSNDSAVYKSSLLHRDMEEERIRIVMAVNI